MHCRLTAVKCKQVIISDTYSDLAVQNFHSKQHLVNTVIWASSNIWLSDSVTKAVLTIKVHQNATKHAMLCFSMIKITGMKYKLNQKNKSLKQQRDVLTNIVTRKRKQWPPSRCRTGRRKGEGQEEVGDGRRKGRERKKGDGEENKGKGSKGKESGGGKEGQAAKGPSCSAKKPKKANMTKF